MRLTWQHGRKTYYVHNENERHRAPDLVLDWWQGSSGNSCYSLRRWPDLKFHVLVLVIPGCNDTNSAFINSGFNPKLSHVRPAL